MVVLILKKILIICIMLLLLCQPVSALESEASAAILYQPDTKTVLYEKNKDEKLGIASTTKIMTALVVLENAELDDIVDIRPEYTGIEGSSMYLKAGERFTVRELLAGMLLCSGNDAACSLAYHVAGGIEAFAELMNEKAEVLGLENTHFTNPHGLDDDNHYSTAFDLALIMSAAMENETFREITSEKSENIAGHEFVNHNKLLSMDDSIEGGKTGYTKKCGRTLVSSCNRGYRLICVTLNCRDDWNEHLALYDMGYSQYEMLDFDKTYTIPVISGESGAAELTCNFEPVLIKTGYVDKISISLPRFVYAPVNCNDKIGQITVTFIDDKTITAGVYAAENIDISQNQKLSGFEKFLKTLRLTMKRTHGG